MSVQDILHRVDWSLIYPPFRKRIFELAVRCRAKGKDYWATEGFRDEKRQQSLYNQGRETPGPVVTNARPWQSLHNYGLAVDFALDSDTTKRGLQPDWRLEEYRLLADEAKALGLEPGFYWTSFREGPHVQWPIGDKDVSIRELHAWHKAGGLEEVWTRLDSKGPWL